jgi:hypothetical protein
MFGLDGSGQLWRYRLSGPGAGWTAPGGYGVGLAVSNRGDDSDANDLAFLQDANGSIWTWDQHDWTFAGQ